MTPSRLYKHLILLLFFGAYMGGCAAYLLDDAQTELRESFFSGDMQRSEQLMERFERKEIYKTKDEVLFGLEYGTVAHFSGNFEASNAYFHQAENSIEANITKSITRGVQSLLISDNQLTYDGEYYEDIYLNVFKSLNYIHQKEYESALVEARRVSFKMEQNEIRLKGLAEVLQKKDSTNVADWKPGKINVQNSALGHYLATVLYAKSGKSDDARIEYERLKFSVVEQDQIRKYRAPNPDKLPRLDRAGSYNVLIAAFSGEGPVKSQSDARFFLDHKGAYIKFSFPVLHRFSTEVDAIKLIVDGEDAGEIPMIEEMDAVAEHIYSAKQPIIYARALARSTIKALGLDAISDAAERKSKGLGFVADVASFLAMETTEKADLRGWQTMPGQAWMHVLSLEPGKHSVSVQYLSRSGYILYEFTNELDIKPETNLELIETLFAR